MENKNRKQAKKIDMEQGFIDAIMGGLWGKDSDPKLTDEEINECFKNACKAAKEPYPA